MRRQKVSTCPKAPIMMCAELKTTLAGNETQDNMQTSWTVKWLWFIHYKSVSFRDFLCAFSLALSVGQVGWSKQQLMSGAGLFVLVFSLYSCFLSADAHGLAHGHLSKLHLFYNLGVRFYLVLVETRMLYLHLLSSRLVFVTQTALSLSSHLSADISSRAAGWPLTPSTYSVGLDSQSIF